MRHWLYVLLSIAAALSASAAVIEDLADGLDRDRWEVHGELASGQQADAGVRVGDAGVEFFKTAAGVSPSGSLSRTIDLFGVGELRVRFKMGEEPLVGFGFSIARDKVYYSITAADEGRFVCGGFKPFYGGPGWRPGKTYEIRLEVGDEQTHVAIVPPDGLPRPVSAYTRDIPAEWQEGDLTLKIGFISRGRPDRGDRAGTAELLSIALYEPGEPAPADVEHSTTIGGTLAKFQQLRAGQLTPSLQALVEELHAAVPAPPAAKPRFEVQAWDAGKVGGALGWSEETLDELSKAYTLLQFRGAAPGGEFLGLLRERDMGLALYVVTRQPHYTAALAESPHATTDIVLKGAVREGYANVFSGDLVELATRGTVLTVAPYAGSGVLRRVMLDSEYRISVGSDPLTRAAAAADGVFPFEQQPSVRSEPGVIGDEDGPWRNLQWNMANSTYAARHSTMASMIHRLWPGVEVTTDPIHDHARFESFRGLDLVQHWIRVHHAPRHPRSVAYYCERGRAHVRAGTGPTSVVIGPQLARGDRAVPADMLSEACWLAVAFGARGVTHWGNQGIWAEDGTFARGGNAAWERLKRLKRDVYAPHEALLLKWEPVPRRMAMLVSMTDAAHNSAGRHSGAEATENTYRALLSVGEPCDVLYEQEILDGALGSYEALVVPSLFVATAGLVERVAAFAGEGGAIITHAGSMVAEVPGARTIEQNTSPRYRDYWITKGEESLEAAEYADFLHELAVGLRELLPFAPRIAMDSTSVVANLMTDGESEYLVLVNDRRTYGTVTEELGSRVMLDEGMPVEVSVRIEGIREAFGVRDDAKYAVDEEGRIQVTLGPGWGKILRLVR